MAEADNGRSGRNENRETVSKKNARPLPPLPFTLRPPSFPLLSRGGTRGTKPPTLASESGVCA